MIEVDKLAFAYGAQVAIFEGFSWRVGKGESWAVIGPSGCGKTTLLYLLAGLRQPSAGTILIAGERIARPRPQTGLILQDHGLLPWATVWDNAALGLTIRKFYGPDGRHVPRGAVLDKVDSERRVQYWLERLGIAALRDKYPGQLSGGQRQRTAIVRTLALEPDLLLMDEPFSSLDAPTREDLQALTLELLVETGLTTVVVTHSIEEAALLGRSILALSQPPNREAHIIQNNAAGDAAYRRSPAFQSTVDELRQVIGHLG
jgi:ABC-type nitrate/sulfonate/bicarbonate transport system ATPase subunit